MCVKFLANVTLTIVEPNQEINGMNAFWRSPGMNVLMAFPGSLYPAIFQTSINGGLWRLRNTMAVDIFLR